MIEDEDIDVVTSRHCQSIFKYIRFNTLVVLKKASLQLPSTHLFPHGNQLSFLCGRNFSDGMGVGIKVHGLVMLQLKQGVEGGSEAGVARRPSIQVDNY